MNTYTLHVSGTHCPACKILIEDVLSEQQDVQNSQVNLKSETITLETNVSSPDSLATRLTSLLKPHGYAVSVEKQTAKSDNSVLWIAIPIGVAILALFILLQKSGIVNLGVGGTVTPVTAFIIGLVASVSSCLAVVGGLVLSLSATISLDDTKNKKPIFLFHSGRLLGFAVLGGVLGFIGHAIGVSYVFSSVLGIIAAFVMILLGANLLGLFTKNTIALPSSVFSFFRKVEHETFAPLIVGVGTFFLPCGFTQSMQVAALSSGSVASGSLIMLSFALGTLPMLGLLSFGAASFAHSKHAPLFFKSAGVFVIGLGTIALLTGLAGAGIIQPLFNL
jgi:sulfite exporter TauE/SafE/copper chaperone CopZ